MLTPWELRAIADYLYDGEPRVAHLMSQIRQYKRGDEVLRWLCRNDLRGKRMVEYFQTEAGNEHNMGVLVGVERALQRIDQELTKLTIKDLK